MEKTKQIDLQKTFTTFDGKVVIKGFLTQDPKEQKTPIILKDILLTLLGNKNEKGQDACRLWSLGRRIYESKKELDVSDEEFAFLKNVVEENPGQIFLGFLIGAVIEYFEGLKNN